MIKKTIIIFIFLFLCVSVFSVLAAPGPSSLKYEVTDNKEITINIWMNKKKAALYLMGNYMFHMKAKFVPIAGARRDNIIELKGSGFRSIHLNRSRKILYFREGSKGDFAKVSIANRSDGTIQVKLTEHEGIQLNLEMKKHISVLYFKGNHMFKMNAKFIPIAGAPRDNIIELKGNGPRKIHLNRSRKILYFREGSKGTFASVELR